MSTTQVAALFVASGGPYFGVHGVDPWDERRDARSYGGADPVVAHPPCERWGRYWHGGPNSKRFPRERRTKGDDAGCFASALSAVRRCGGVLEHPADSSAWDAHGIIRPPSSGGWVSAGLCGGWTCRVEQGHYGHRARKGTWLYAYGVGELPSLIWGPSAASARLDDGYHPAAERLAGIILPRVGVERLSKRERLETPPAFRDLLLAIARSVKAHS